MLIIAVHNKTPMKYSAKSTPEVVYKLCRIFRALSFAGVWIQLSIRYGRTKRFRERSRYDRPACRNMTGTSWCCAQPWMVNDSFHCSYSKSGALAPTTESSSCHQAQGQTIATDVLRNRSKLNVIFVMRTLCVVCFFCRDTSGQGRFCTIFRSYSRGAQVQCYGKNVE